jgi:hypothetical protein
MRKQIIASGLVVAAIVIVVVAQAAPASASHFTHWILIRAPFSGYWDRFGIAHPSYHQTHFGGDWGVNSISSRELAGHSSSLTATGSPRTVSSALGEVRAGKVSGPGTPIGSTSTIPPDIVDGI